MDDCARGHHHGLPGREALDLLDKYHQFPGEYMFKIIGFANPEFTSSVRQAAETVLGALSDPREQLRTRPSSGGRYLAVTLEVTVADAAQVLAVYAALKQVPGVVVLV